MILEAFVPPAFAPAPLDLAELNRRTGKTWQYAASGRAALFHILRGFDVRERLLVPGYICDTVLEPLRRLGIAPVFYDVDARDLNGTILMAKMRAASNFAQTRVHADLNTQTFWVEVKQSGATSWTTEGGTQLLSTGVTFGFGSLSTPPSNTQATLAQAPGCPGISNTACVVFNSRGIPVDSTNTPTANDALYVTDGRSVTGVTVLATGLSQIWRSDASTADWTKR